MRAPVVMAMAIGALVLACGAGELAAKRPTPPPGPPVPVDTTRREQPRPPAGIPVDTSAADTIPADTTRGEKARGDTIAGDTTGRRDRPGREGVPVEEREEEPLSAAADSVVRRLRELEGYIATEYAGDSAVYRADTGVLRLLRDAEVQREGSVLTAVDSIVYRERSQLVEAHGTPRVVGAAQDLTGDVLYYDLATERATALGARTEVTEQATWYVEGDVTLEGTERVYATGGTFTTDDREEPQYHFQSDRIKVIRNRVLVAAPARLYFGKVPVMWLPFIVHDMERGRRSGILAPEFGVNDIVRNSSGYTREISNIGFYWAINDYMGAELAGNWRSDRYTSLSSTLNWNWRRQFLNGNASVRRYWREEGSSELRATGGGSWKPNERTDLNFSADYASSSRFFRQVSTDPREVTQELGSTVGVRRRFDWGNATMGATRRQNVSNGSVQATLPRFSISPNTFTLFRAPGTQASWYNNASVSLGVNGERSFSDGQADFDRQLHDEERVRLSGGLQQFTIGNFRASATGNLDQRLLREATGLDTDGEEVILQREHRDRADWQAQLSYQQRVIGQTSVSPTVTLRQEIRRDPLSENEYVSGPTRTSFGAGSTAGLFGFYPGIGPFSAIRHRLSPTISYAYSPEVRQTALQEKVFGEAGGRAQNRVSLTLNQTWEAKLRRPASGDEEAPEDSAALAEAADSAGLAGDTTDTGLPAAPAAPAEAQKVTLLSITTSAIEYDFAQAAAEGSGFVTERLSNSISSDYLRGMTVRMEHELFDRSMIDPNLPENRGELGTFAPRLTSLSTSFSLGPNSSVVRWIQNVIGAGTGADAGEGPTAGREARDDVNPEGTGAATGNPRGTGSGPWRVSLDYRFTRDRRTFSSAAPLDRDASQTVAAQMSFALTPNWAMNWTTDYSLTDREFGSHRLVLRRDLYRWEADFSFTLTPYGNSSFNMLVRLKDLPDLKFDYREPNLGIDRDRDRGVR
jgi:lipopolysaccharide export system protein LptA